MRVGATILIALTAAGVLALWLAPPLRDPSPIAVMIGGEAEDVAPGIMLADAAARFHLRPRSGNLLDVEGKVLRDGVYPGRLLLDGHPAPGQARLREGDSIGVENGVDRTEPLSQEIVRIPGGAPSDPQFFLERTPGEQVVTRGMLSHKLLSLEFRPTGKPHVARAVALTFDDGPSPRYSARILAVLRRLHARATFFVVGSLAERYPQLVRRELRAGMVVGNHTYHHPNSPFDRLPRRRIRDEIAHGQAALGSLGLEVSLFRPPGGGFSPFVVGAAQRLGQRVVLWSIDPADWRHGVKPKEIIRRVLRAVRPGSIVLLHDGGGDRSATVAALPAIIKGIRSRGLRLVRIAPR